MTTQTTSQITTNASLVSNKIHSIHEQQTNYHELDLDWIREEELLLSLNELLQNTPLTKIRVQFLFVDLSSSVHLGMVSFPTLEIDTKTADSSILPKTTLIELIERAKQEYVSVSAVSAVSADSKTSSRVFALDDILIWNHNVDSDHIQQYAESCSPDWISTDFIRGSISQDIVLSPSIFVLHSIQTIYVILRETPPPPSLPTSINSTSTTSTSIVRSILRKQSHSSNKHTKRVHFSMSVPSKRTTRKHIS